jgi:hypothetical protein
MAQDFVVVAACFNQSVGQDGHPVKGSVVVDCPSHLDHRGCQQREIESHRAERQRPKNFPQQACLRQKFARIGSQQRITGNPGLCAAGGIPGSNFGFRGGSVPTRLTSGPLTGKSDGTHFVRVSKSIGVSFRNVHR